MEYTLSMSFLTDSNEKYSLSVSGVRGNLTEAEAGALMDIILANDIFISTKGTIVSKHSAKLTQRAVTDLTLRSNLKSN